jgi:hypothetical protein
MRPAASFTECPRLSALSGCGALAIWIAPFILLAFCTAQEAPITFPVDGVVENSLTHQPIARALVESNAAAALTDSEGRFELSLPAGVAYLGVRRPGFGGEVPGRPSVQQRVAVSAKTPPVTIFLTPVGSITGHVTLSSGDQPSGLQFVLNRRQIESGHSQWRSVGGAVTDSDGTFHLPALATPASYVLCIAESPDRDDFPSKGAPGKPIMGYPSACYPGGFDLNSAIAAPLTLSPGQQAQLEISLTRQPFYPVSIRAGGSNLGGPLPLTIFDHSGRPLNASMRLNDQTGAFEFNLPNGSYYAEARGFGNPPLEGRLDFTVAGAPVSGLTLVPTPVVPIRVEVREEFTASAPPASGGPGRVRQIDGSNDEQPPVEISFHPVDQPLDGSVSSNIRRDLASPDTFLMDQPEQGVYMLDVEGNGRQVYAASVTSGSSDLLREPLVVGPGGAGQPIQIVLRNDTGFLACTPKADPAATPDQVGAQSAPIPIFVISLGAGPRQIRPWYTRGGADVQMPALPLPPGKYLVLAFENDRQIDLDNADAMSKLAAQGQTVTIQPGATLNLQVEPIRDSDEEAAQ